MIPSAEIPGFLFLRAYGTGGAKATLEWRSHWLPLEEKNVFPYSCYSTPMLSQSKNSHYSIKKSNSSELVPRSFSLVSNPTFCLRPLCKQSTP